MTEQTHLFPHPLVSSAQVQAELAKASPKGSLSRQAVLRRLAAAGIEPTAGTRTGQAHRYDRDKVEALIFGIGPAPATMPRAAPEPDKLPPFDLAALERQDDEDYRYRKSMEEAARLHEIRKRLK